MPVNSSKFRGAICLWLFFVSRVKAAFQSMSNLVAGRHLLDSQPLYILSVTSQLHIGVHNFCLFLHATTHQSLDSQQSSGQSLLHTCPVLSVMNHHYISIFTPSNFLPSKFLKVYLKSKLFFFFSCWMGKLKNPISVFFFAICNTGVFWTCFEMPLKINVTSKTNTWRVRCFPAIWIVWISFK